MSKLAVGVVILLLAAAWAAPVYGQEAPGPDGAPTAVNVAPAGSSMAKAVGVIGACIGAALCVGGGGYGIARIGSACIESIARQPEAGGAMFAPMVVAAAMVEGGMLFAIVVCLLAVLGLG